MKNILIVGCSHSCGMNLYHKMNEDIYDRSIGWVATLAKFFPEHNFYNYAAAGTGFNLHDVLINKGLNDNFDLIIVQLSNKRYTIPINNFELTDEIIFESEKISNLTNKTFDLKNCLTVRFENENAFLNYETVFKHHDNNFYNTVNNFYNLLDNKFLEFNYNIFLEKISRLQQEKRVAIICYGGTNVNNLLNANIDYSINAMDTCLSYIEKQHSLNRQQAYNLMNRLNAKHNYHFTEELQTIIFNNVILRHDLIRDL